MEVVGILVVNGALWATAWSVVPAQPPWLPVGITPGGLLLQLGLYGLIRTWRSPQSRAFWVGFVAVGSLVYGSYLSATVFTNVQAALALWHGRSDPSHAGPLPAVLLWRLWNDYVTLASHSLGRPAHGTFLVVWSGKPIDSLIYALIVLVPHLLAAMVAGIVRDSSHRGLRTLAVAMRRNQADLDETSRLGSPRVLNPLGARLA